MLVCLIVLTVVLFALTIYNILQANAALLPSEITRYLVWKILDPSSAASLFVTAFGALLVRHQFALSLQPRINYKSFATTRPDAVNVNVSHQTWRVEVRNTGVGSAIITRTEYLLELPAVKNGYHSLPFESIVKELARINLVRGEDYWLENISTGFALSPKEVCLAFEIKGEHLEKLKRLDMTLYFRGQIGDRYFRQIALLPRRAL